MHYRKSTLWCRQDAANRLAMVANGLRVRGLTYDFLLVSIIKLPEGVFCLRHDSGTRMWTRELQFICPALLSRARVRHTPAPSGGGVASISNTLPLGDVSVEDACVAALSDSRTPDVPARTSHVRHEDCRLIELCLAHAPTRWPVCKLNSRAPRRSRTGSVSDNVCQLAGL